jgi:hypothetical protein
MTVSHDETRVGELGAVGVRGSGLSRDAESPGGGVKQISGLSSVSSVGIAFAAALALSESKTGLDPIRVLVSEYDGLLLAVCQSVGITYPSLKTE